MPIRLSGMSSGLDTESLVTALVSSYSLQKDNLVKAQTKLSWKQDAWKSMNTKIYNFYTGSLSSMQYSKNYALKKANISNSNYATVSAASNAVTGTQSLKIRKLATSGYLTGGEVAAKTANAKIKGSSRLSEVQGISDTPSGKISITSEGSTKQVEVTSDMTVDQFVARLKDAGVNASFDENNQRFFISAKTSGASHDFSLSALDNGGNSLLSGLKLNGATVDNLEEVISPYRTIANNSNYVNETAKSVFDNRVSSFNNSLQSTLNTIKSQNDKVALHTYEQQYAQQFADAVVGDDTSAANTNLENEITSLQDRKTVLNNKKSDGSITEQEKTELADVSTKLNAAKNVQGKIANATWTQQDRTDYIDQITSSLTEATNTLNTSKNNLLQSYQDMGIDTTSITIDAENGKVVNGAALAAIKANGTIDTDAYTYADAENNGSSIVANAKANAQADFDYAQEMMTAYNTVQSGSATPGYADALAKLGITSTTGGNGAVRVYGSDSEIELNGATFKNNTNNYSINGLTITATAVTGDTAVSITTESDVDGIYDQIKSFISDYNTLIKGIDEAYNATSAKGYEPLTSDEKQAMTDDEVDKWEKKVKDALLRKDSTLGNLSSAMKTNMMKAFTIDGQSYTLSSFGIGTGSYFSTSASERGVLHIDGDEDDNITKSNADKLKEAIAKDPDKVISFFSQLAQGVYKDMGKRMQSSSISSAYTIYNDKELAKEYSDYTTKVSNKEDEISKWEDYYYTKFSRMESALASLNSQSSSLSGLF